MCRIWRECLHLPHHYNHSVETWNVSNVRDMSDMFKMAESFNQPLEKWDVSHVQSMTGMFCGAISYRRYTA